MCTLTLIYNHLDDSNTRQQTIEKLKKLFTDFLMQSIYLCYNTNPGIIVYHDDVLQNYSWSCPKIGIIDIRFLSHRYPELINSWFKYIIDKYK